MSAARRACLAALLALAGWACNRQFDFDEHTPIEPDAAPPADAPPPPDAPPPADMSLATDLRTSEAPVVCSAETPACSCSGTFCSCARHQWCRFTGSVCTPGTQCAFLCHNDSRCEGQCQRDCKLECENQSTCTMTMGERSFAEGESSVLTVTVGPSSKVHCENNATCHVTCTGSCTLECQSGARCDLKCAGDANPRSADQGGACR